MNTVFILIGFTIGATAIMLQVIFTLFSGFFKGSADILGVVSGVIFIVFLMVLWVIVITGSISLYESIKESEKEREEQVEDEKYIQENMENVTRLVEIEIKNVRLEEVGEETYRVHYVEMVEGLPVEKYRDVHKEQVYKIEEDDSRLTYRVLKDKEQERFSGWFSHSIWQEKVYVRVEDQ